LLLLFASVNSVVVIHIFVIFRDELDNRTFGALAKLEDFTWSDSSWLVVHGPRRVVLRLEMVD